MTGHPSTSPSTESAPFQKRVLEWLMACFSMEICRDTIERNHRFLEEGLELVQSLGCTASEAHQLVDYIFARPVGDPAQEVGGVMNTLAALCSAADLDMEKCGDDELARVWTKIDKIRAKQAAKPKHSPLPQHVDGAQKPTVPDRAIQLIRQLAWYYDVNDCRIRPNGDALEVPILDLCEAKRIALALKLPTGPGYSAPTQADRAPKVRTSHHRNKEEATRLQTLVDERYAREKESADTTQSVPVPIQPSTASSGDAQGVPDPLERCKYCGNGPCENCMNSGYAYPDRAELALAAIELAKLPGDVYWLLAKGRTRPDEPLWAVQLTDLDANKIAEAEGDHPADCVRAAWASSVLATRREYDPNVEPHNDAEFGMKP